MPLTPAFEFKEYCKLLNTDLKQLLIQRGLPRSGTKAKMVARLITYDDEHPFPFMKLPGELRNMIYKIAASHKSWTPETKQYMILGSGLFRCSKQTRTEGLPIGFQHRHFYFRISYLQGVYELRHHGSELFSWLDRIGPVARENICHLTISVILEPNFVPVMDCIHARLSNKACVTYQDAYAKRKPWVEDILAIYKSRDPQKVPSFERGRDDFWYQTLTFLPGLEWFGGKNKTNHLLDPLLDLGELTWTNES